MGRSHVATTAALITEASAAVPDRIAALDVLRGIAVGGILFINVLSFFGILFMPPEVAAALPSAAADRTAAFLLHVFVEGKFYSIFSLLFGIGFGVQLARGGEAALPRFTRRLRVLLAIGAVHAFLIWAGDILMLYALLAMTLPWFARKPDRELLRWTVVLLAAPTALYAVALVVSLLAGGTAQPGAPGINPPPEILAILERMGRGGVKDALLGNLVLLAGRWWFELVMTVRFPKVLAMFVLGLWAVRTGIALAPAAHRPMLVKWMVLGWGIGLPTNVVGAWAFAHWSYLPPSAQGLLGVVAQGVGFPLLALGYAATVALLVVDGRRIMSVFAPVGRMALTNYLTQSIVCTALSYGWGLSLWWAVGTSRALAIAAAIFIVQIPLSALWLTRFRLGPMEWIWRRLAYQQAV